MRVRFASMLTVIAMPAIGACVTLDGAGRSLVQGALGGASEYVTTGATRDSVREMLDSIAAYAGGAVSRGVLPPIDSAVDRVVTRAELAMERVEASVNRLEDTTLARLRGPMSDAVNDLIRSGTATFGNEGAAQVDIMLAAIRSGFETELAPALNATIASAVDTMVGRLAVNLQGELLGVLARAADSIAAAGARAAVRAGDEQVQRSPFMQNLRLWGPWIAIALLSIGLGWYWYTRRRSERALTAVMTAIRDTGNDEVRRDIRTEAERRNVEAWLNKFLRRRGYLEPKA